MSERNTEIAQTILNQLGGGMFRIMTGAKNFTAVENGLQFKIGGGASKKINFVEVKLDPSDTYTVKFSKIVKFDVKPISEFFNIYCDELQELFTTETGFYTHL